MKMASLTCTTLAQQQTPEATTTTTTIIGKKRKVRFDEYDNDSHDKDVNSRAGQIRRHVVEIPVPKSSLLTPEEKRLCWMQQSDHRDTLHDVMAVIRSCRHGGEEGDNYEQQQQQQGADRIPFAQYAKALAMTFTLCDDGNHFDSNNEEDEDEGILQGETAGSDENSNTCNIREQSSVLNLALWAVDHTATRGVESKLLPGLMEERQKRRSHAIQVVLEVQRHLRNMAAASTSGVLSSNQDGGAEIGGDNASSDDSNSSRKSPQEVTVDQDELAESLCAVSEILTHSAKQFASAMAVVDSTQAFLEYTDMVQQQQQVTPTATTTRIPQAAAVHPTPEILDQPMPGMAQRSLSLKQVAAL